MKKIDEFCNTFSSDALGTVVHFATGRAAAKETKTYLLGTLDRGQTARKKFEDEWNTDPARFLKATLLLRMKRRRKKKTPAAKKSAECLRDFFHPNYCCCC